MFSQKIEWCLIMLVIMNVAAITLGTVNSIYAQAGFWLNGFEGLCVAVFGFRRRGAGCDSNQYYRRGIH
jgi:hypothetical protein